jgi:para-aminobenzoate synthetase component I
MTRAEAPDLPLVEPLAPYVPPELALERLAHLPKVLFLDSALADGRNGRYSFLCADPVAWLEYHHSEDAPLTRLAEELAKHSSTAVPGLPPFQGGAAGLFGYELAHSLERIPRARFDEFELPVLAVGIYDVVLAYDRLSGEGWLISQGIPASDPRQRRSRSEQRLRFFQDELRSAAPRAGRGPVPAVPSARLDLSRLSPQFTTARSGKLTSNFSHAGYLAAVQRCIDYICSGDVFQVNLSQRLLHPAVETPLRLYRRSRELNAAPMAAYFDIGPAQILSASPERFVRVVDGIVETRPIKGTRTRSIRPEADLFSGDELKQSEKDRAENIMIVDLMRNDLARVCTPESVEVTQLCDLETFAYVQHLVSTVKGRLRDGSGSLDLIRAAFPGGSITGAPKIRAMEIIAELEPTARGAYCGSIGYIGLDGTLDTSILIRTITSARGWWQLPVGGGVVAQSIPQLEYEETWHKAEGLLRSLPPADAP